MSHSKPVSEAEEKSSLLRITLPQAYGYLTIAQAGSAVVFSTFLLTHLSATALANVGGIDLANKTIVLGRVYYQSRLLEPIVVFGSFWLHVTSGVVKRGIRLFWKHKKHDQRRLTGEVSERVEKIVSDEKDDSGKVVRQKITTKTTTTITTSLVSQAAALILPLHHLAGYLLLPTVIAHYIINRILPRRHFGDSSLVNATYITLALKKWPKTTYLAYAALIGLGVYHVVSGVPAALRVVYGSLSKKNADSASEKSKGGQTYIRNGVIVASVGLLAGGLLVIGGKIGRENIKIPLRAEYLKILNRVYPYS